MPKKFVCLLLWALVTGITPWASASDELAWKIENALQFEKPVESEKKPQRSADQP
jgi:hypothetical protein